MESGQSHKLNIHLPYQLALSLPDIYSKELNALHKKTCMQLFITVYSEKPQTENNPSIY